MGDNRLSHWRPGAGLARSPTDTCWLLYYAIRSAKRRQKWQAPEKARWRAWTDERETELRSLGLNLLVMGVPLDELPPAPVTLYWHESTVAVPPAIRAWVLWRDYYQCVWCGTRKRLEIDHIKPRVLGVDHHPDNLQALCRTHNKAKSDTFPWP